MQTKCLKNGIRSRNKYAYANQDDYDAMDTNRNHAGTDKIMGGFWGNFGAETNKISLRGS